MKIYMDTPALFVRPTRNTDWRYMKALHKLSVYIPVDLIYPFDVNDILYENINFVSNKILRKIFRQSSPGNPGRRTRSINIGNVRRSSADVVYSHRHQFPVNIGAVPAVWFYSVADPRMLLANGVTEREIAAQYERQGQGYRLATKVQVTTEAEVKRHAARFPELADRFVSAPWFRPDLSAISPSEAREKHSNDETIKILFIGRQARRKGLDILLDAIRLVSASEKSRLSLDIVSSFSDGPINLDVGVDLRRHTEITDADMFELLRRAHVYAMPCRLETFGLVFIEAMSHGCAVLGPDWEVQQEILDYGDAGANVALQKETICAALREICFDRTKRLRLAEAAIERFVARYSPASVAKSYLAMFEDAIESWSHGAHK